MKTVIAALVLLLLQVILAAEDEKTCTCSRKHIECCREQKEKMKKMKFRPTGVLEYKLDELSNRTDLVQRMQDLLGCLSQQTDNEECLGLQLHGRFRRQDQSACKTQNKIVAITEVECIASCGGVTRVPVVKDDFGQYPYFFTPVCQSVNSACGCGSASKCRNKKESHGVMARVPIPGGP